MRPLGFLFLEFYLCRCFANFRLEVGSCLPLVAADDFIFAICVARFGRVFTNPFFGDVIAVSCTATKKQQYKNK